MKYKIIPTIIANNQKEIDDLLLKYKPYFKHFQIDVMDGKFVKNKSNWFDFKLPKGNLYEAHLMVDKPEDWIKKNYNKFDTLIANFEKVKNPNELIKFVKSKKKEIGFALNPETSLMHLMPYLKLIDVVLILTVHPGQYGAKFLPEILEKIEMLRMDYKGNIEVDGHQDFINIQKCKKAGANLFAVGSYLKNTNNLKKSAQELKKLLLKEVVYYKCGICGLIYESKDWAEKCEKWCKNNKGSCNSEILKRSINL